MSDDNDYGYFADSSAYSNTIAFDTAHASTSEANESFLGAANRSHPKNALQPDPVHCIEGDSDAHGSLSSAIDAPHHSHHLMSQLSATSTNIVSNDETHNIYDLNLFKDIVEISSESDDVDNSK